MTYGPEEACFALPVPRGRVHEMGLKSSDDDTTDVVDIAGDDHGLDSETSGRKLSNEGVADCGFRQSLDWCSLGFTRLTRTDSDIIGEGKD